MVLSYLRTQHENELPEFVLLPEGLSEQEAADLAHQQFRRHIQVHELSDPRELPNPVESAMTSRHLDSDAFMSHWHAWGKRVPEVRLLTLAAAKHAAVVAAQALGKTIRQPDITPSGWTLAHAMSVESIPVVAEGIVPFLAHFLGLICDTHAEGARDFAQTLRRDAGLSYANVSTPVLSRHLSKYRAPFKSRGVTDSIARLLRGLPRDLLQPHQDALDQLLWSNPTEAELKDQCQTDQVFVGPLPVRLSLAQVLGELLHEETLRSILYWAHDEPVATPA